ncbi:MAG: carboxypeptidase-like regulatory domain-containing protein, partial [Myxococcaceae bacterium]|nr:carboxypeptidase-like regulatory domain-containing protein [Myxococcaceae bacterium]
GPIKQVLLVRDERGQPLPFLDVELIEVADDDEEARDCDEPGHLAEHLARWKTRRPLAVVLRGRTDALGALVIPAHNAVPDEVRVRSVDGQYAARRPVLVPGEVTLEPLRPGPWRIGVLSRSLEVISGASVTVFDPRTGQLTVGTTGESGVLDVPPCPSCIAVASAPGAVPAAAEVSGAETVVWLVPAGRVEVRAPWAPDGLLVTLRLTHPRRVPIRAGVAHFEAVPAQRVVVEARPSHVEYHQQVVVTGGQTSTVTLPELKGASVSVSVSGVGGVPVAEATLSLEPRAACSSGLGYTTLTDSPFERLELEALPEGPAEVKVSAPGHRPSERHVVLQPGRNELEFVLERIEPTHGLVLDEAARPIAGATVVLGAQSVLTDEAGRFVLAVEKDGPGEVSAPGFETQVIALRQGGTARAQLARTVPLRVNVTDPGGRPTRYEVLQLAPLVEVGVPVRCLVIDGACEAWLRPGVEYRVLARASVPAPAVILVGRATQGFELHLREPPPEPGSEAEPAPERSSKRTVVTFSGQAGEPDEGR